MIIEHVAATVAGRVGRVWPQHRYAVEFVVVVVLDRWRSQGLATRFKTATIDAQRTSIDGVFAKAGRWGWNIVEVRLVVRRGWHASAQSTPQAYLGCEQREVRDAVFMRHGRMCVTGNQMVCSLAAASQGDVERSTCVSSETEPAPTLLSLSPPSASLCAAHYSHESIVHTKSNITQTIGQHRSLCFKL